MLWVVLGDTGLFGSELRATLAAKGNEHAGFSRLNLDFDDLSHKLVQRLECEAESKTVIMVNALGYAQVDNSEQESVLANKVNAEYALAAGSAAQLLGARFLHISTDYVFEGNSIFPYTLDALRNPQSAYGRSKLAGEIAVQESGADYQIFRTAWLYGANGNCFPKTVARVLKEQGQMKVVNDQVGQPTWTKDLAALIVAHQDVDASMRPSMVHATASGSCSWYEFAREIALSLGYDPDQVIIPITTAEYPTPAKRPAYSVLDNVNETGLVIGDWRERWREAASLVLAEYLK